MGNGSESRGPGLQGDLFGGGEGGAGAAALVQVAAGAAPLGAAQREFNRLTERIRREREALAAWETCLARFQRRVAGELRSVERELRGAQRRVLQRLDEVLAPAAAERLSRRRRAKARLLLLDIADDLLRDEPDATLEALYEKHANVSHADSRRQEMEAAEALIGEVFGAEVLDGHQARDADELLRHAGARIDERAESERTARGRAKAERKAQTVREASGTVREIYRRLASALHPDREADAVERERKTRMMQRANQAYERDDLLELLALQVEIEQSDACGLAAVPDERLRRYNDVLREQLRALEARVRERAGMFRMEIGLAPARAMPRDVDQALDARIVEARQVRDTLERYFAALGDARLRCAFLDELPDPQDDSVRDLDELAALAAMFGGASPGPRRRSGRKRRR